LNIERFFDKLKIVNAFERRKIIILGS
jgi:hypothetical protein